MRSCPSCNAQYSDGVEICAHDGHELLLAGDPIVTPAEIGVAPTLPEVPAGHLAKPVGVDRRTAVLMSTSPKQWVSSPGESAADRAMPTTTAGFAVPSMAATAVAEIATEPAPGSGEIFDSLVGATLAGRYRIIRRIGEGGMGAVYEAKHTIIGKRVAVKVLLEKFLTKSDFVARLLQEARLASSIGHENIVDVTDFGTTDDGRSFVVMEFLDGESLAQLVMREAPLPVERSLRIARQVASALGAAHAKGIFHRDVKPENVYLVRRGDADFVKVVDFGISKAVKQGQATMRPELPPDPHRALARDAALHVARAGARRRRSRPPRRHLGAGRDALRVPDRRGAVPRQQLPGHHLAGADAHGGAAVEAASGAGDPRGGRGRRDARDGKGSQPPLPDDGRSGTRPRASAGGRPERWRWGSVPFGDRAGAGPRRAGRALVWGVAIAALIGGVAMVLARPEPPPGKPPGRAATGAVQEVRPAANTQTLGAATHAPDAPVDGQVPGRFRAHAADGRSTEATRGADPSGPRRPVRVSSRSAREKIDRAARAESAPSPPRAGERAPSTTADAVIRGAVRSRSVEGYPEN